MRKVSPLHHVALPLDGETRTPEMEEGRGVALDIHGYTGEEKRSVAPSR